ncbi:MAG: MmgE/PrpD family protein [Myxococcota bacterium]
MDSSSPHLATLGHWAAAQRYANLPTDVVEAARHQLASIVAAAHAGARIGDAEPVLRSTEAFGGGGNATVLGTGARSTPADAAFANAACSMAHDFDDVVWMGHTGHSTVLASLAVAEDRGADGRRLLEAIVVGTEVAGRVSASSLLGPLNGQMWTFIHLVGAAAATARLLDLDGEQTTHALAIALSQPNFALQPAFLGPSSKLLSAATPTRTGMEAAYLARAGVRGAPEILEDPKGFWARFSYLPLPAMLEGLGDVWVMRTLQVKTYPGCHYFQTACSALEEIVQRTGPLSPEAVSSIRAETTKVGLEATRFAGEYAAPDAPLTAVKVNFDLGTTLAVMLHAGRLGADELVPEWLADNAPAIEAWRGRIGVRHDPALTAHTLKATTRMASGRAAMKGVGPRQVLRLSRRYRQEYRSTLFPSGDLGGWLRWLLTGGDEAPGTDDHVLVFPNRVTIRFTDGGEESLRHDLPAGAFGAPGAAERVRQKLQTELTAVMGAEEGERVTAWILTLDEAPVRDVARRLAARPAPDGATTTARNA